MSYCQVEELMEERGVSVDHATINRWVLKHIPPLEEAFHTKATRRHGVLEKITIDGSEANAAALRGYTETHGTAIEIRQVKYLNNLVKQDHRGVVQVTRPMLGFKSFEAAQGTLISIEPMHMLKIGQLLGEEAEVLTPAEQCYALAA